MAITDVDLFSEDLTESLKSGFLQYDTIRVYQVLTDDRSDGAATVLSSGDLPGIGSALAVGSVVMACVSRKPKRVGNPDTATKWMVSCKFTNATEAFDRDQNGQPTDDPEQIVKEVRIDYESISTPLTVAEFLGFSHGPYHDKRADLDAATWITALPTAPVNSAMDSIYIESSRTIKKISVTKHYRDWPSQFDDWLDSVNDSSVTIEQEDADGVRASYTFEEGTLKIDTIDKDDIWKDGKLYFKATFVLTYDPHGFVHSVVDQGQRQRVYNGAFKSDGTQWTQTELDALDPPVGVYGLVPIEQDGYASGEPVPLNGAGQPLPYDEPGGTVDKNDIVYANWRDLRNVPRDFSELEL